MRKHIKGSVATYYEIKDDGQMEMYCRHVRVLKSYGEGEKTPPHWPQIRISELQASVNWALNNIPVDILEKQLKIEDRE